MPIYAEAKARLGTERTLIVSGDEGLDELSLAGGNEVADVQGHEWEMRRARASDAGLPTAPIEAIRGGDAAHNAKALKALLMGAPGPYRDAVLFNAGAALMIAGRAADYAQGAVQAAEALDSGRAETLLGSLDRARTMNKLAEICATKREEVAERRGLATIDDLDRLAREQTAPRGFRAALEARSRDGFALIAEIKKASPSKGLIRAGFSPSRARGRLRSAEARPASRC